MRHTDVVVVGAGPAGMAAATAAARGGRSVLLVDDSPAVGGQIWRETSAVTLHKRKATRERALEDLSCSGAMVLTGWKVFDASKPNVLSISTGDNVDQLSYEKLIIATGARERFLPFPGWTMQGVFGVGGLQALVKSGFPVAGKRIVVAGSGPLLLAVAALLQQHGATVVSTNEQASFTQLLAFTSALLVSPRKLWQGIGYRLALKGSPYRIGCWPVEVLGETHVQGVRLTNGSRSWDESCDLLACGFHLVPNTELASLLGCAFNGDFVQVNALQESSRNDVYCIGEPTGIAGLEAALIQGEIAGLVCCGQTGKAESLSHRHMPAIHRFAERLETAFQLRPELRGLAKVETIVCRCEDVRFEQLVPCTSWTEAKLQTRCGMGPCQGRICGPATNVMFGWRTTSVRAPLYPVPIAAFCKSDLQIQSELEEIR